jgi:hypothetical protein
MKSESQLLNNADKISHIPVTIVQGRYDVVCPAETAWQLHKVFLWDLFIFFRRNNFFCRFCDLVYRQINFIVCLLDMFLRMEMKIKLPLFY